MAVPLTPITLGVWSCSTWTPRSPMPYIVAYSTYACERFASSARARSSPITLILADGHCLRRRLLLYAGRLLLLPRLLLRPRLPLRRPLRLWQSRELLLIRSSGLPLRLPGCAIPLRAPRRLLLLLLCIPCTNSCYGVDLPGQHRLISS